MEPDKILHYEAVLADLEAQRRELDSVIATLRHMLQREPLSLSLSPSPIPINGEVASDTFLGMSIAEALELLFCYLGFGQKLPFLLLEISRGGCVFPGIAQ